MKNKTLAPLLAYVTGLVNQHLLLQNGYLAAENRILRARLPTWLPLDEYEGTCMVILRLSHARAHFTVRTIG